MQSSQVNWIRCPSLRPGCIGLFYDCTLSSAPAPFAHETRTGTPLETSAIFIDPFAFSSVGLSVQHLTVFVFQEGHRGGPEEEEKKQKRVGTKRHPEPRGSGVSIFQFYRRLL